MPKWMKRAILGVGLLLALVVAAAARLALVPSPRTRIYSVPNENVPIPSDSTSIAHGKHFVEAVAVCITCHGENLGGKLAFGGKGHTSNLTSGRGGIGKQYRDADWVRTIRHGVKPNGRGVLFMPSDYYANFTDSDLGAMVAYLSRLPPVDNEDTDLELGAIPRLLIDLGAFGEVVRAATINHEAARPAPPADYGQYLVSVGGCTFCHGESLTGGRGPEPGAPMGPSLAPGAHLAHWSFADFAGAMRTGTTPEGRHISPLYMPWLGYMRMTDDELRAIWRYLKSLPST
jgi:cytochrome c553